MKDSQGLNGRRGRSSRRNSHVRSEMPPATAEGGKRRRCKTGQVKCRGSSNKRSGDARPGREREWNQEPSSHRRAFLRFSGDSTITKDTRRDRTETPDLDTLLTDVSASSNLCIHSSLSNIRTRMMLFGTVYQPQHVSVFGQLNGTIPILDEDGSKVLLIVFGTHMATGRH